MRAAAIALVAMTLVGCGLRTKAPPPYGYPEQSADDPTTSAPPPLPRPVHPSADLPPGMGLEKIN